MARKVEINKGKIQDNALKALVKSNLFQPKTHKPKKGKGAYSRKGKKSGFLCEYKKPDFFI
ncbi:MAG: alternative ribosome rescue factor ArfA [Neisseria sp.]|uniref:alternative ribosome rescue factor ArfA n=1 Tax=Neisseria sp. TaxID=192066 RepID=UPI0026DCB58F|nr:alternative ribosome rescue factor ArfA [Neisseria sp.]MDO4640161.1 alternative ribosome rescue factor ArfA [Neisseria sp.]